MPKFRIGDRVRYLPAGPPSSLATPRHGRVEGFITENLIQVHWDDELGPQTIQSERLGLACGACGATVRNTLCPCGGES